VFAGVVRTNIFDLITTPTSQKAHYALRYLAGKNCHQGAQTTLHCVLTDENVNGKYYAGCREERMLVRKEIGNEETERNIFKRTKHLLSLP
jgi:hypothetical protein